MSEDTTIIQKLLWPILSLVFGAGAGIGGYRVMSDYQNRRIKTLEEWVKNEGLTAKAHCAKCHAAQAESIVKTKDLIDASTERIMSKMDAMNEKLIAHIVQAKRLDN